MKYVLAYKFSQDPLEVFSSATRSRCGHNNSPTAHQFESVYKCLLIHCEVTGSQIANCQLNDHTHYKLPNFETLSFYVVVVSYIAGFAVWQVLQTVNRNPCICALTSDENTSILVTLKQYSLNPKTGLINASPDVIYLWKLAEKEFKILQTNHLNKKSIIEVLVIKCLRNMHKSVFKFLHDHV